MKGEPGVPTTADLPPEPPTFEPYDAAAVEERWRRRWREAGAFATPEMRGKTSAFVKVAPPFTSGRAHIGHVRSYSIADAEARFRRARGEDVLFALGFDAFGLPAEREALEQGLQPQDWVEDSAEQMRGQFERLGLSFDWERTFITSRPAIYRWSQWLFLTLLEAGLVEQSDALADWCPHCETALSRLQAADGRCWRCDCPTTLREQVHWYLKVSVYNEENYRRLKQHDSEWSPQAISSQYSQLGRIEGIELDAEPLGADPFPVFTPHVEKVASASFIAISPRDPLVKTWLDAGIARCTRPEVESLVGRQAGSAVDTGLRARVPGIAELLPVLVAPIVEGRFGPTAVLGIPEADPLDAEVAQMIPPDSGIPVKSQRRPLLSRAGVRYRAGDFPVSRPRAWGAPIPVVHCEKCGVVPVPLTDLPVLLPRLPERAEVTSGLAGLEGFVCCECPDCGGQARRDCATLDCHFDALWMYVILAVPPADRDSSMFKHPELQRWLPMADCIQGVDTGGFILNERVVAKALRDLGAWDFMKDGEPFGRILMHGMVRAQGRKMSKHLKNGIDPEQLVREVGADALRFALLFAAAPAKEIAWDPVVLRYSRGFLGRLWEFAAPRMQARSSSDAKGEPVIERSTVLRRRLALWTETALIRTTENFENLEMHRATRNVIKFLDRLESFERRRSKAGGLSEKDGDAIAAALLVLIRLLAPLAPHLAQELWSLAGNETLVHESPWPAEESSRGQPELGATGSAGPAAFSAG